MLKPQKILHLKDALKLKNPKLSGIYSITEKFDGWWVAIEYKKETGFWYTPISSSGRTIPALQCKVDQLNRLPKPYESCYLLAEAIIPDTPFEIINGRLNRSVGDYACHEAIFIANKIVFPGIAASAASRQRYLDEFDVSRAGDLIVKAPVLYTGEYNKDVWRSHFEKVVEHGGEGIVAERHTALYQPTKRNADLLKDKLECTVDVLADSLEEGVGKKGNPSLTLICIRKNGVKIRAVVSKHEDQDLFRSNPSAVLGKVVELKAMEELADGQLRQAVYRYIRHDKLITDIN